MGIAVDAVSDSVRLRVARGGSLTVDGDSTLHAFHLQAPVPAASVVIEGAGESRGLEALTRGHVKEVALRVAVSELRSGESGLDDNLRKALRADRHPFVSFTLERCECSGAPAAGSLAARLRGRLSIAGKERAIDIAATVTTTSGGLRVTGSKELLMSDFGVDPPRFMLGVMKVRDRVIVRFDIPLDVTD